MKRLCFLRRGRGIVWLRLPGIELIPIIIEERGIIVRRNCNGIGVGRWFDVKIGGIFFFESRSSFRNNRIDPRTKRYLAIGRRRKWLVFARVSGLITILDRLKERETIGSKELSRELNVSEATIRRDLEGLKREGKLVRVRSGARRVEGNAKKAEIIDYSQPILFRGHNEHAEEKRAVAKRAATFVHDGDCIFIDGGTSLAPLIDYLSGKKIKIVTHNIRIVLNLKDPAADIFLVGGYYKSHHATTVGYYGENMISQFHFDHAFFGCSGVNLEQQIAFNNDIDTIPMKKMAMKSAEHKYLLIDSSKLSETAYCRFCSINEFDYVLCNCSQEDENCPANFIFV